MTIPLNLIEELTKSLGKDGAKKLVEFLEENFDRFEREEKKIKEQLKAELYNELRNELATKEFVRAEINEIKTEIRRVEGRIDKIEVLLKVLIGLSVFGITILNPNFLSLIEKIFK